MKKLELSPHFTEEAIEIEAGKRKKYWSLEKVSEERWIELSKEIASGKWTLFGLWGSPQKVNMVLLDESQSKLQVIELETPLGKFPSVAIEVPSAARLERTIHDLFGLIPEGSFDNRPWLDHGKWQLRFPLGSILPPDEQKPYPFFLSEGENLHQIPVGPVHAGIIEPGHFRFTMGGEIVVRMEERLGYTHKGIEKLFFEASIERGAEIAARISGDATVAYSYAYALAVEEAMGITPSPRAVWLRALMAEMERMANHFGDIGAICNDAAFPRILSRCAVLREKILRFSKDFFGHRLMMGSIVPGGLKVDLSKEGKENLYRLLEEINEELCSIKYFYDSKNSLQDRTVGTGVLNARSAKLFGAGGFIGRASGRNFDARKCFAYPPYDKLSFESPLLEAGDVNARVWIRILEIEQSSFLIEQILNNLPSGSTLSVIKESKVCGQGLAVVESFRGDILLWIEIEKGKISRCHPRDPSWFQWPLLEKVIVGAVVADFPLCNKSFNCSYSGHDL